MAYINRELVLELLKRNSITKHITLSDGVSIFDAIASIPTADVVPKSEADKWYYEYHAIKDELKQEKVYHSETDKLADRYCAELLTAKSEVERLEKALAAQELEYSQALQDKARECNIAIDKICLEHREEIRRLQESHEQELAKAKSEREVEIVSASFVHAMADLDEKAKRFVQIQYAKAATEICYEIGKEISAALHNNYRVRGGLDVTEYLYYIVNGKISALRGIEGFVEELKKKYTEI